MGNFLSHVGSTWVIFTLCIFVSFKSARINQVSSGTSLYVIFEDALFSLNSKVLLSNAPEDEKPQLLAIAHSEA